MIKTEAMKARIFKSLMLLAPKQKTAQMKKLKLKLATCLLFITGLATTTFAQTWQTVGTAGFSAWDVEYTSLAFSNSGEPYVAFRDDGNSEKATVMKFDGSNWINVGAAGFSAGSVEFTSLAFSSSGEPYVAYRDSANSEKATVMKFDGSNWVNVGTAGFSAGSVEFISLAFSSSGEPYVAYRDDGNSEKATAMKFDGSNWVNVGTAGFSAGGIEYTSLAFSGSGEPYVAYRDDGNSEKATVMKFDGSNWVNVGTAGFSAGVVEFTSLAFSGSGEPYVAYRDVANSYKATVMKFDGSNWVNVGTAGFSAGDAEYTSLAFSSGEPYVAYKDDANSKKATVMKFDGSNWVNVGTAGFSAGVVEFTSLAFSNSGEPYVAYKDVANSNKATVMKFATTTSCSASFTYNNTGTAYNFQNTSTGSNLTYFWFFGDTTTSTAQNPTHTYTTAGTYNVYLIISGSGCSDTTFRTITVSSTSSCMAYFGQSNSQNVYTFINYSQGNNLSYSWNFGDGSTSTQQAPVHTFSTSGIYNVCLIISNTSGCLDTFCRNITVTVPSSCSYTPTGNPGLYPSPASFPCIISGQAFSGTIYFENFDTLGGVAVQWLRIDSIIGLPSNIFHDILPDSLFYPGESGCINLSGTTNNAAGTYPIAIWVTIKVSILPTPVSGELDQLSQQFGGPSFAYHVQVCAGGTCQAYFNTSGASQNVFTFNNYSQGSNLSIFWTFGDGDTSYQQTPTHTYMAAGAYTACLYISNTSGCLDTFCRTVNVTIPTPCQAYFNTSGTSQNVFTFNNYSQGSNLSIFWTFGDGDTSYQQTPTHTYMAAGAYTACLYISNTSGCLDTFCRTVNVTMPSSCSASFTYIVSGNNVSFSNTSTNATTYYWFFGDNTVSSQSNPAHNYSQAGSYYVCLVGINSATSCRDTSCATIYVPGSTACQAYFSTTNTQNVYTFTNYSQGSNLFYNWYFGDGNTDTVKNPVHTYASSGTYNSCLIIFNTAGCVDTFCKTITVTGVTVCNASFTYTNQQNYYFFQNSSTGNGLSYYWSFGDGDTSALQNPTHAYSAGTYNVCLSIAGTNCQDSYCDSITVSNTSACSASFSYTVSGNSVTFNNTSSNFTSSFWSFGDGSNSTSQNPTHTYAQNGTYQACLTIYDSSGCSDNVCQYILISTTTHQYYCVSGRVTKGTATNPAYPATVYLIYSDTALGTLTAIRTTVTDQSGNYQFCTVPPGKYLVKAALNPTALGYSNYVPTYFGNSLFWSYATEILVNHNFQQIDIWLIAGSNPGGPGFVGGFVSQGANKMAGPGDPIEGVQVMLLDEFDNPVQYIYSDSAGKWDFSNVAYGTYKVYAEVLGIPTFPYWVTIGPDNETVDNISLIVESTQVISNVTAIPAFDPLSSVNVYPNPTHDELFIEMSVRDADDFNVIVTDVAGKTVVEEILQAVSGMQTFSINLSQQQSGIYLLNISGSSGMKVFKVVKY